MAKTIIAAAVGLWLASLLPMGTAGAQQQGPIGHRQPAASEVPANDSVRGDSGLAGAPTVAAAPALAGHRPKKRSRSRRVQSNVDVIMKTPNICSNCNQ
ncbi:MAG: hypothetical protein QOF41_1118 [Methylobacteriaceae bacterium]|nr:hypothetical protein [Methylobacteriaceae bacterium]